MKKESNFLIGDLKKEMDNDEYQNITDLMT